MVNIPTNRPHGTGWVQGSPGQPSTRALDGDVVVIEKLTSEDVADSLERADKRLRRDVADGDFGKTEAQLSTTVTWCSVVLKMAIYIAMGDGVEREKLPENQLKNKNSM